VAEAQAEASAEKQGAEAGETAPPGGAKPVEPGEAEAVGQASEPVADVEEPSAEEMTEANVSSEPAEETLTTAGQGDAVEKEATGQQPAVGAPAERAEEDQDKAQDGTS